MSVENLVNKKYNSTTSALSSKIATNERHMWCALCSETFTSFTHEEMCVKIYACYMNYVYLIKEALVKMITKGTRDNI